MNLLEVLKSTETSGALTQIARKLDLGEGDVARVVGQLAPALGKGLSHNVRQSGGLEALVGALQQGNHRRFLDEPATLADAAAVEEGNGILGHLLGSKDASRNLAGQVSASTGVSDTAIKQMLPLVASMTMGALSKRRAESGDSGNPAGFLTGFLDSDGDGSVVDDLLGAAGKFFKR